MVAHLLRLRLLVMRNTLSRSPWQLVAVIIGAVYGIGILVLAFIGLTLLGSAPVELARTIVVLAGAATVLGWAVVPLLTSGIDQTLSVARLRVFPIAPSRLVLALAVCGVLGIPGAVTLLAGVFTAATWWRSPGIALAAVVTAAIAVLTCVCASRMIESLNAGLSSHRRYREISGILVLVPLLLLGPLITVLTAGIRGAADALPKLADGLSWSPLGAAWSVPSDLALGHYGEAGLKFLIAVATLAVIVLIWRRTLATALVTTVQPETKTAEAGHIGLFGWFPASPTGAVAARSLTYWTRDPRYSRQLILIPIFPILLYVNSRTLDLPSLVTAAGPVVAFLVSLSIFSDLSYDSTAFAAHLSARVTGRADRTGRVAAVAVFAVPVVAGITVGSAAVASSWAALPALLGLSLGILLSGLGLSSLSSSRIILPVPAPGDSPFAAKTGAGFTTSVTTFATWGILAALSLPEIVLAVVAGVVGSALLGWITLVVGLGLGAVVLSAGIRLGGREIERSGPELLARLRVPR
ncbi:ABC-2 type transport system permease protein [Frondihabitans sp. PhB188]|uniref:transporter n=1 Tax=Frondihabitans sp. PhB188 TaxID=2485200 RepID=UPI000F49E8AF|nr:transporter [Frondihabitans sp. PhB188]ROQ39895.1 ABC-2 type transport system permease protein [Frondihabitans sp. PhB188]